ncbi:MAG: NFYB/HAP3 family transcription factor subunit [Spirochaetales bacterium]|nr:NFYB/HAP3 family transcription factor subunit [Spirochaetales bacterium]
MAEKETLVVSSKVKNYIKSNGDLKCSAKVIDALSDKIREICDAAIENAVKDKRKTVQEKDIV